MKMMKYFLLAAAAVAAISCSKEIIPENSAPEVKLVPMTFTASHGVDSTNVQPSLSSKVAYENKATVWKVGDMIKVIAADGTATDFKAIEVTREGKSAKFEGLTVENANEYYAVYPASAYKGTPAYVTDAAGGKLVVEVPHVQEAVAGTFHPSALLCIANTKGSEFQFKHSCAFLKFNIAAPEGVKSVRLKVNGSTNVAGIGYVGVKATDMNPKYASSDPNMSAYDMITLNAPEGGFETGKDYFIAMRANSCPKGITAYIEYEDNVKMRYSDKQVFVAEGEMSGSIGKIQKLGQLDKNLSDVAPYDAYNLGADLVVAGKAYSPSDLGTATLVSEITTISANGVYFIAEDVDIQISKGPYSKLFIVGNSLDSKTKITLTEQVRYSANGVIGLKNLAFAQYSSDMFVHNNTAEATRFAFDNCKIIMPTSNGVMYNGGNRTVNEFAMHNCDIQVTGDSRSFIRTSANYSNVDLHNNIFYSAEGDKMDFYLINYTSDVIENLKLTQNTFANVYNITSTGGQNPFINVAAVANYTFENNLFYLERYNTYGNPISWVLSCTPSATADNDNMLFKDVNNQRLKAYKASTTYTKYTATKAK